MKMAVRICNIMQSFRTIIFSIKVTFFLVSMRRRSFILCIYGVYKKAYHPYMYIDNSNVQVNRYKIHSVVIERVMMEAYISYKPG